nr:hypothetical protein [Rhizobium setariae]
MEAIVKHQTFEQLQSIGATGDFLRSSLPRTDRLARWAELLEQVSHHQLSTLYETEYEPTALRAVMRADCTPISVAFKDPILRAAGLHGDTYDEAKRFFEINDEQLHRIVCFCHFGNTVSGADSARRVREVLDGRTSLFARLRALFTG